MGDSPGPQRSPEPPAEHRPLPGVRLRRAVRRLRRLRRRGARAVRRLGCALVVLAVVVVAGSVLFERAADGISALFGPDPVQGNPFDTVTPSTPPSSGSERIDLITRRDRLIVGVQQVPGLVEREPATREYSGFDVALAGLIARELGVDPSDTAFKPLPSGYRESALIRGEVDLMLGGYSVTEARRGQIGFAGPYLDSPQRLAVPAGGGDAGGDALRTGTVCAVEGSPVARSLTARLGDRLLLRGSLDSCAALLGRRVDAVAGDELRLATLVAEEPGALRLTGPVLGQTRYGIGLAPGDEVLLRTVQGVLRRAVEDGTWARLYAEHLGTPVPEPPQQLQQ